MVDLETLQCQADNWSVFFAQKYFVGKTPFESLHI